MRSSIHAGDAKRWVCVFLGLIASLGGGGTLVAVDAAVACVESEETLEIRQGGKPVLTYQKARRLPEGIDPVYARSGFIHPLTTPLGRVVTDGFPLPHHTHQHGLFFAWTSATFEGRKIDFWNQQRETGEVRHDAVLRTWEDEKGAGFQVRLVHSDRSGPDGEVVVLHEIWTVEVPVAGPGEPWLVRLTSEQTCVANSPLKLNQYHYGAMGVRGSAQWIDPAFEAAMKEWEAAAKADASTPYPAIEPKSDFLTSEGKTRKDGNHTRPHWVSLHGKVEGAMAGVAILSHPSNFRHPQAVRLHPAMPYFCFMPVLEGAFEIGPEEVYVSRYAIVVHDGAPDKEALDRIWENFAR